MIPTWTRRRARWRPSVASEAAITEDGMEHWMVFVSVVDLQQTTSLVVGFDVSKEPKFVAMFGCESGDGFSEDWKVKELGK